MCSKTFKSFECYQTNVICVIFSQVQDAYYGQQEARIGHFPSSIVEETHALMPATTEVKTTVGEHTHAHVHMNYLVLSPDSVYLLFSRNGTSTVTDNTLPKKLNLI